VGGPNHRGPPKGWPATVNGGKLSIIYTRADSAETGDVRPDPRRPNHEECVTMKKFITPLAMISVFGVYTAGAIAADAGAPAPTPSATASKQITVEQLGAMLDAMGYAKKPVTSAQGTLIGYDLSFEQGSWTLGMRVELSADGSNVWFIAGARAVQGGEAVPGTVMDKLLALNDRLRPGYVTADDNGGISFDLPVPNCDVTPAVLRQNIATMVDGIRDVVTLLDTTTWPKIGGPTPAAKG
jgi:hypothetical protein